MLVKRIWLIIGFMLFAHQGGAQSMLIDDFSPNSNGQWSYFADTVMGGVSNGSARIVQTDIGPAAYLYGRVSTANNGGFIQIRTSFSGKTAQNAKGLRLRVKGNGETYYIHLRTSGSYLPWQYYSAEFPTTSEWTEVWLPFDSFVSSGRGMRKSLRPRSISSLGVVAYGKDHRADLWVEEISLY
ncbi:CIA30 family protein [Rhodobacteraceae bacterium]|jgi:hypothetical protein|nr:CIA30 family protein [Paracoccaceae bacterium]|tara:strand:- start:636 stop:1187 length:552 start_codon:yes stop_codon:yes gene_type:complete